MKEEYEFSLTSGIIIKFAIYRSKGKDIAVELKKIIDKQVVYYIYEKFC